MRPGDLTIIAKELSEPINTLALLVHPLGRRLPQAADTVDLLQALRDCIQQLRRQVASLIDYLRLEQDAIEPGTVEFPLLPLLERAVLAVEQLAEQNGVRLRVIPTDVWVRSDPAAVEIILRNLLVNAVFCSPGGKVILGCRHETDAVQLQVCDNGKGISAEQLGCIFEPLVKLPLRGEQRIEGLGLGLAIVRGLAQRLGLALRVRSRLGKGSAFSLTLPRVEPDSHVLTGSVDSINSTVGTGNVPI